MSKPQPVQISIPNPCNQSWDEMTPVENGRFCDSCRKCVIDFTQYSDAQLFDFFNKHKDENICGKYRVSQLDRDIIIPQQRESRLFRMVASIGFALLLAQIPSINLYAQSPIHKTVNKDNKKTTKPGILQISGKVVDEKNVPIIGAVVQVFLNGASKGGGITDKNGNYIIKSLEVGKYKLRVKHTGLGIYTSYISLNNPVVKNVQLKADPKQLDEVQVVAYKVPLIMGGNMGHTVKTEEIERMGGRSGGASPMVATTTGVYQKSSDETLNITGARDAGTTYIIDGIKVTNDHKKPGIIKRTWTGIKKLFN